MQNPKTHKLTSILLAIALVISPFATLQAAVWAVVDCPDKTMAMSMSSMNHSDMGHESMVNTDVSQESTSNTPCSNMDNDCHVSAHSSAVISSDDSSFPEMLSSFEPTPNQSFSVVTLPTEIKPPISL